MSQITAAGLYGYAAFMATVSGLFVSHGRGSGRSEPRERVEAIAGQGLEGCAHANRGKRTMLAHVVEGGEIALGDAVGLL